MKLTFSVALRETKMDNDCNLRYVIFALASSCVKLVDLERRAHMTVKKKKEKRRPDIGVDETCTRRA